MSRSSGRKLSVKFTPSNFSELAPRPFPTRTRQVTPNVNTVSVSLLMNSSASMNPRCTVKRTENSKQTFAKCWRKDGSGRIKSLQLLKARCGTRTRTLVSECWKIANTSRLVRHEFKYPPLSFLLSKIIVHALFCLHPFPHLLYSHVALPP